MFTIKAWCQFHPHSSHQSFNQNCTTFTMELSCYCHLSLKFKLVWICANNCSNKMTESNVVACVHFRNTIAATKCKLTKERASFTFPWSLSSLFKLATEHVDGQKSEQFEDSLSSTWNLSTTEVVIQFYKDIRLLWDKSSITLSSKIEQWVPLHVQCL